jgi:hypothetical protein
LARPVLARRAPASGNDRVELGAQQVLVGTQQSQELRVHLVPVAECFVTVEHRISLPDMQKLRR